MHAANGRRKKACMRVSQGKADKHTTCIREVSRPTKLDSHLPGNSKVVSVKGTKSLKSREFFAHRGCGFMKDIQISGVPA